MATSNKNKISIESVATYALHKIKPGMKLDFPRMVKRLNGPANFMLLIPDQMGKLNRVYLVTASPDSIRKTDQPFHIGIMGYFRKHKTNPDENYYILKIQLDKNNSIHRSREYPIPDSLHHI